MESKQQEFSVKDGTDGKELSVGLSRRSFLNTAGVATVGGLMVAAGGSFLGDKEAQAESHPKAPPLPWRYVKLDPLEAGKRGYKNYLANGG